MPALHTYSPARSARRHAERKTPGQQRVTHCDRSDGETVADENGGIEGELGAVMVDLQTGFQAAGGDGDIVVWQRQAGDIAKGTGLLRSGGVTGCGLSL